MSAHPSAKHSPRPSGLTQVLALLCLLCPLLPSAARAAGVDATATASAVTLSNERLTLTLSKEAKGALTSLVDTKTGTQFVNAQPSTPLFALGLSKRDDRTAPLLSVNGSEAAACSLEVQAAGGKRTVLLAYQNLKETGVNVLVAATVALGDPLVRWRLSAELPAGYILEEVHFPLLSLRLPLAAGGEEAVVMGTTKGGVGRPAQWKTGAGMGGSQPGSLAAQFGCYYGAAAGLYTAACDGAGYPKRLACSRTGEGLRLQWTQNCFATASYALDFDLVLTTFNGTEAQTPADWRDAADLYRQWALKQPWCARPLSRRTDLPSWLRAAPAMVRFSRAWLADPRLVRDWLTVYWGKHFPRTPLVTAYWGWEKVETWVTPDYFPVYPSDEAFTGLAGWARARDCHAFLWPSGYHWTQTFDKREDGSFAWDDRERFDKVAAAHAVHTRDGKVISSPRSWLRGGVTSCLCPGDPWTIDFWNRQIAEPIARRGGEIIQFDQVVGGAFPFCYSETHGHPPGPGRWMTEAFARQLQTEYAAGRKLQKDFVVCFEEPNEHFNHLIGLQDYRDCESPHEWASVYNYLYHDFVPTFQSNPRGGDIAMAAYCFANGQMPHLSPSLNFGPGPALTNGGFEKTGDRLAGWDQVKAYQGREWKGVFAVDGQEKHGGATSLRLDNPNPGDVVQVSQNVVLGGGTPRPRRYRLSAWIRTDHVAAGQGIGTCNLSAGTAGSGSGHLPYPAAGAGWQPVSCELSVPEGSALLRIMIHIEGLARVWVDDMTLEELLPEGKTIVAPRPELLPDHDLLKRWVELYHGTGRPYLFFGRMLHPPLLKTETFEYRGRQVPAIMHNAFEAPDGSKACLLVNATSAQRTGRLLWGGRERAVTLPPCGAELIR